MWSRTSFSLIERPIVKLIAVVLATPPVSPLSFNMKLLPSLDVIAIVYLPGSSLKSVAALVLVKTKSAIAEPSSFVSVVLIVTVTPSGIGLVPAVAPRLNVPSVIAVGAHVASAAFVIHVLTPEPLSAHICETSTRFWMWTVFRPALIAVSS